METNSIWKKLVLLSFGTILALHVQVVRAQDEANSDTVKSSTGSEECVITEDQL